MKLWESVGTHNWNFLVVHIRSIEKKMFRREFQAYLKPVDFIAKPLEDLKIDV